MAVTSDEHTPLLPSTSVQPSPSSSHAITAASTPTLPTPTTATTTPSPSPLSRTPSKDIDAHIIDFHPSPDPANPLDWPRAYKYAVVSLLALNAFTVTFTCIGVVPVASRIIADLSPSHTPNKSASVLLVTVWELGEACGPLLIGPLSEILGRVPVINAANLLFILATATAALSRSVHLIVLMRACTGAAVVANVLGPAIVGDVFPPHERGTALSMVMFSPLLGGAVGPALAGAIVEGFGWRWMLWACVALMGLCAAATALFLWEPYRVVILRRKVERLRVQTGNEVLRSVYDDPVVAGKGASRTGELARAVLRPFPVFFRSPVLILAALYGSTTFTFFYIMSTTLPDILTNTYHLSPSLTGLSFMTFSLGSLLAVLACNLLLDRIYIHLNNKSSFSSSSTSTSRTPNPSPTPTPTPENRLPLTLLGALLLPVTIYLYGHLSSSTPSAPAAPLPYLLLDVACMGNFLLLGFLPITAYVVDAAGPRYAASAMTAVIVVRCLFGTFLPLGMQPLVDRVGLRAAFAVAAGVTWAMGGVVVVLWVWGARLRRWTEGRGRGRGGVEW